MNILIRSIGIALVIVAVGYLVEPGAIKAVVRFIKKWYWFYLAAILRIVIAVIFFVGAGRCRNFWNIVIIGGVLLVSGIAALLIKPAKYRSILDWPLKQPDFVLRLISLVMFVIGLIIVFSA